jgi:hypothetical protein
MHTLKRIKRSTIMLNSLHWDHGMKSHEQRWQHSWFLPFHLYIYFYSFILWHVRWSQNNLIREAATIARSRHGKHATALLSEHSLAAQRLVANTWLPQQTRKQQRKSCWKRCFLCGQLRRSRKLCNITAARKIVFCGVHPKGISREPKPYTWNINLCTTQQLMKLFNMHVYVPVFEQCL